ncbi:MAG: hypothetical protein R3F59_30360 [Myxococcota bacterium]
MSWLPTLLGVAVLAAEAVGLGGLYLWLQPASASWLNVAVGSVALASMVGMLVYSIARRVQALRNLMRLSGWLQLHIFLGLQGVLLAWIHCLPLLWRHGWPIPFNPGLLNLYAVSVVFASGLFGRYLYAQVPKTLGGRHMALRAVDDELAQGADIPPAVRQLWEANPGATSLLGIPAAGRRRRRALRRLARMDLDPSVRRLAARRVLIEHQRASMVVTQRVFRFWILAHRPVAAGMYLLSGVHVLVSVLFSTGWGWW